MTDEAQTEAAPEVPAARIITDKVREKLIPLEYPVEFDGKLYTDVRVRRVTAGEVRDYLDKLRNGDASALPPVVDVPLAVWEVLDADDMQTIDEAAAEFMPKRLRALVAAGAAAAGEQEG